MSLNEIKVYSTMQNSETNLISMPTTVVVVFLFRSTKLYSYVHPAQIASKIGKVIQLIPTKFVSTSHSDIILGITPNQKVLGAIH